MTSAAKRKPYPVVVDTEGWDYYFGRWYDCPVCGKNALNPDHRYCPICGVPVKWPGEVEEDEDGEIPQF